MKSEFDGRTLEMILAETHPYNFIRGLLDFAINPNLGGVTPLDLEAAPPLIKGAIFLNGFSLATCNSGIGLWFDNDYDDCPDLAKFFDKIGAKKAVQYLQAGTALFPKGCVPKDSDERLDYYDAHGAEFCQIDRQFGGAADDSILKLREYLMAHQEVFEQEVKVFWELRKSNKPKWRKKKQRYL
jgi:hypothetical protein